MGLQKLSSPVGPQECLHPKAHTSDSADEHRWDGGVEGIGLVFALDRLYLYVTASHHQ